MEKIQKQTASRHIVEWNVELSVGTHRKFEIVEHKDTFTIVRDLINFETYTSNRIYMPESEEVILYISRFNFNGKPLFDYSVLNCYEEEKEYTFDVVLKNEKGFRIENIEEVELFIPLSFENAIEKDNTIKLKIKSILVEKNRVLFHNPESSNEDEKLNFVGYSNKFFTNQVTEFSVVGMKETFQGFHIFQLEKFGVFFTVKALDFQIANLPEKVVCRVLDIQNGYARLVQDKATILKSFYKVGESYDFEVISHDEIDDLIYLVVKDHFGMTHRVFLNKYLQGIFTEEDLGAKIPLIVNGTSNAGHLLFKVNTKDYEFNFFTIEDVLGDLDLLEKKDRYFTSLKEIVEGPNYENSEFNNLFKHYDNKENLWFLSYLSFIHNYIITLSKNDLFDEAIEFNDLYIILEEWMLEGSHFINSFSNDRKESLILKAENQLQKAQQRSSALEILRNGNAEKHIQNILKKIQKSGFLRADSVSVLKTVLSLSKDFSSKNTKEILDVIAILIEKDILEEYDCYSFNAILEYKIKNEKLELNNSLLLNDHKLRDDDLEFIENIVKIQAIQILLNKKSGNQENEILLSASLLRYLSYLTKDKKQKENLLSNSVYCITNSQSLDFSIEDYNSNNLMEVFKVFGVEKCKERHLIDSTLIYENNGAIYKQNKGWTLLSASRYYHLNQKDLLELKNVASYFNENLIIGSPINNGVKGLTKLPDFSTYYSNWNEYIDQIPVEDFQKNVNYNYKKLTVGTEVKVMGKNFLKGNKKVLFVKTLSKEYFEEGIIHVSGVSSVLIDGLNGVLFKKDIINTTLKKITQKGLEFSIIDQVWGHMREEHSEGDEVIGKVVSINGLYGFIITDSGCFCNCISPVHKLGGTYRYRVVKREDRYKTYTVELIETVEEKISPKKALRSFLITKGIVESSEGIRNYRNSRKNSFYKNAINQLILSIEACMNLEDDFNKKTDLLFLLRFLASLIKHSKSYYFNAQLSFLKVLVDFKDLKANEALNSFEYVQDETLKVYGSLDKLNKNYDYLSKFNRSESLSELMELTLNESDVRFKKIGELIMANNLIQKNVVEKEEVLNAIKEIIFDTVSEDKLDLSNEIEELSLEDNVEESKEIDEIINLGKEGKFREFKTSYVYSTTTHSINVEEQSKVILKTIAGFLNAQGGSLFIGVNDDGEIIGLNEDYKYLRNNGNADSYERFIRKNVVTSFSKDINGQLEFKFSESNKKEYVEIVIPEYERPVSFENNFFQRQGNETRILKGNDLILFFERKFKSSSEDVLTSEKNLLSEKDNGDQKRFEFYEGNKQPGVILKDGLAPKGEELLANVHFYKNGTYTISKKRYETNNVLEIVPIHEDEKHGYLIQAYDNGCVNKVEVRTLLDKQFGYNYSNGISREGNLMKLCIIKEESLIELRSIRNNQEFIKLFKTDNISTHSVLNLKGNDLIQESFDYIKSLRVHNIQYQEDLKRLVYTSRKSLGKNIISNSYKSEFKILENLNLQ